MRVSNEALEASRQKAWAKAMKILFAGVAVAIGGAYVML